MSDYRTCDVRPTVLMSNYHIDPIEHVPFVMSDVHTFDLKIFVMSDVHTFDLKLLVVLLSFSSLDQQFFRIPPSSPSPPVFAALFHMTLASTWGQHLARIPLVKKGVSEQ